MTQLSEKELLGRIRRGDQAALGQLLQNYHKRLYNVCLRMVSNRDDAAEATQEAMLKIVQHIDHFRGDAQLSTWMIRIAMNQATTLLRRRRVRQSVSLDQGANPGGNPGAGAADDQARALRLHLADSREPSPQQRVQQKETHAQLHTALGLLEEDFRAVLVLRDLQEMDYQQISEVLDLPMGTVKSRLFRARLALRQELVKVESSHSAARPEVNDD